ncbi:MAG: phosphatidate cytidylyltransferase [Thermomicrobiales bacterium]
MRQRTISSVFIVALTLVPAFFGRYIFAVLVAAVTALALHELYRMFRHTGARPLDWAGYLALASLLAAALSGHWAGWSAGIVVATVLLPLLVVIFRADHRGALTDWALTVAGGLYIALPAAHFVLLRELAGATGTFLDRVDASGAWQYSGGAVLALGLAWYLLAQIVTWLTDVGAYLVGRTWGRRKLAPVVSPGKSVEGALGGLVGGALAAWGAAAAFGLPVAPLAALAGGAVLSALGQLGDLAESLLKRQAGVKDSGTLIPGHGGILDRIDSLLFVATATYYLARLLTQ